MEWVCLTPSQERTSTTTRLMRAIQPVDSMVREKSKALYYDWRASTTSMISYLLIVSLVSLYDMILTVRYAVYLKHMEQNPIGRWLMQLDSLANSCAPDLTIFLTAKFLGTLFVLGCITWLVRRSERLGHPIAIGVSSCQILLAGYLTFGTTPS